MLHVIVYGKVIYKRQQQEASLLLDEWPFCSEIMCLLIVTYNQFTSEKQLTIE